MTQIHEWAVELFKARDRYDELAQRIMLYHHLDATIESDVAEFGELRKALGKDKAA